MSINRVSLYHLETLLWIDRLGTFSAAAHTANATGDIPFECNVPGHKDGGMVGKITVTE